MRQLFFLAILSSVFADAAETEPTTVMVLGTFHMANPGKDIQLALAEKGIAGELRFLNDPVRLAHDNDFYRVLLHVGAGAEQPGAELLTAWYSRNFQICARLLQLSAPGDRVVVLFGWGHSFLLRQCVQETPGLRLAEPNDYLPK